MTSACGDEGAILRGTIRLAYEPGGQHFIGLAHEWLGNGPTGGFPHAFTALHDVDLNDGPVAFQLDMCSGCAMYSEENCSYQLIAIHDKNADQAVDNRVPGADELSGRIQGLEVSGHAESPCLDIVLDCIGPDCGAFEDPTTTCECSQESCPSKYTTCQ